MNVNNTMIDRNEYIKVRVLYSVLSSFSISGSLFVLFVYWYFKDIRTFTFEVVIWLILSCLIDNSASLINLGLDQIKNNSQCIIQGFIQITFDNSILIWAAIIGYTSYMAVKDYNYLIINRSYLRKLYIIIAFICPIVLTLGLYYFDCIGPSGGWCWLDTETENEDKQNLVKTLIVTMFFIMWIFLVINSYFIIKVVFLLNSAIETMSDPEKEIIEKHTSKLKCYPIAMIICVLPSTINRLYTLITGNDSIYLIYIQTVFDSLTGLIVSIIFGLSPAVKDSIKYLCRSIFMKKSLIKENDFNSFIKENDLNNQNIQNIDKNFNSFISNSSFIYQ